MWVQTNTFELFMSAGTCFVKGCEEESGGYVYCKQHDFRLRNTKCQLQGCTFNICYPTDNFCGSHRYRCFTSCPVGRRAEIIGDNLPSQSFTTACSCDTTGQSPLLIMLKDKAKKSKQINSTM